MKNINEIISQYDFSNLSNDEKSLLAEYLQNEISEQFFENDSDLTDEQKKELDKRIAAYEAGKTKSFSWDEVKAKIYQVIK